VGTLITHVRKVAILAIVPVLMVVTGGCKADVNKEVLFVNDSVVHEAIMSLVTEFNSVGQNDADGRYAPNFGSSTPGIGLKQIPGHDDLSQTDSWWTQHMTSLISHVKPEVIVVELGYNDCGRDLTSYGAAIDNFMATIPPETPVHWLTMADARNIHTCDETINAAITEALTRWPNLSIFDLAAHMQGHPEWTDDSIHLNPAGQNEFADWLHHQLDAVYNHPPAP
jgi:lysophospholipase L1-like esterase